MGLFSKILGKLGIGKKDEPVQSASASATLGAKPAAAPAKPVATAAPVKPVAKPAPAATPKIGRDMEDEYKERATSKPAAAPAPVAAPAPKPISEVDVVQKLEELGKGKGLDWKVSIVDLLKLLDLDSSKASRIELAQELGCPAEFIGGDYSKMNVWLHKEVLRQIAANGGNIPKELLD